MRVAVLTDIHSNLPGLEAVLESIDSAAPEQTWCLGDVVGYGAQPDECTALVREHCDLCLVGNHDLAVTGEIDTDVFSASAAAAVEWTRRTCSEETMGFLNSLKPESSDHEVGLYHASPRDPVWEYVLAIDQARECMEEQSARVSLIGHSHVALFFSDAGPQGSGGQAPGGHRLDLSEDRWLVNPGSAGQPRDGDPRVAWLELDTEAWTAAYHRVDYDIGRAADAIREAGLPDLLADRLSVGQ
ncbi:MAG TPA: metallophosphoesterase family protein [Solirubrobacterales bacterium]|jgi:diadenosine tetraphosphatase ApaH/serine/threonine PP2A family protein phosphatase|nr:metallophosphoesterase family protein [Solirubrobacterales bacterium]